MYITFKTILNFCFLCYGELLSTYLSYRFVKRQWQINMFLWRFSTFQIDIETDRRMCYCFASVLRRKSVEKKCCFIYVIHHNNWRVFRDKRFFSSNIYETIGYLCHYCCFYLFWSCCCCRFYFSFDFLEVQPKIVCHWYKSLWFQKRLLLENQLKIVIHKTWLKKGEDDGK